MDEKAKQTIKQRQQKDQQLMVDQLKKTPIVQIACEKTGVSRATYYRWRKESEEFAQLADAALAEGSSLINDMAESQLLAAIRDQNLTAIIFWLKHHHAAYGNRIEITGKVQTETKELSNEQQALISKALQIVSSGQQLMGENQE